MLNSIIYLNISIKTLWLYFIKLLTTYKKSYIEFKINSCKNLTFFIFLTTKIFVHFSDFDEYCRNPIVECL